MEDNLNIFVTQTVKKSTTKQDFEKCVENSHKINLT